MMKIAELRNKIPKLKSDYMDLELKGKIISNGLGFFPYGSGLLNESKDEIPESCLMVVGQDFGTVTYVDDDLIKNGEKDKTTFRNTLKLIENYSQDKVFLTNLFLGLRNDKSMIGMNPSLKKNEQPYLECCFEFFKTQLLIAKPKQIIFLGKVPYNFICDKYEQPNFKVQTFSKYYSKINSNEFLKIGNINVLCIQHPSMLNSNVKNEEKEKFTNRIKNFLM